MIADMVMDAIRTRRERRIQKAISEGIAWNRRRMAAKARGEPFDEPFPYPDSQQDGGD